MGEVYRAYDERLSRWVAVKQVRPDKQRGPQARNRLLREARAAAGLAHPAIVQIFDILDVEEGLWVVMELVDGQTLASLLREGPLDVPVVARIGRQIAEGLAHAHEMGIVHRDLKVENVMLSTVGRTRILDFGLVKDLNQTDSTQTVDGAILGTLRAMSPEQALGQPVDSRSDLFSLGTLLYECLAGIRPFEGPSAAATLQRVVGHVQEPVSSLNHEVPSELSKLVDELLEKLPERRPGASEIVERLQQMERLLESVDSNTAASLVGEFRRGHPSDESAWELADSTFKGDHSETDHLSDSRQGKFSLTLWFGLLLVLAILSLGIWSISQKIESESQLPDQATGDSHQTYMEGVELLEQRAKPGDLDRAINLFSEMAADDPESASVQAALAKASWLKYRTTQDQDWIDKALVAGRRAVEKGEYLALAHASLANVFLELGQLEEARISYETALRLDPTCADAHLGLAKWHEHRGETESAEKAYRRALEVQPNNRFFLDGLGTLFFRNGRYDEAQETFERSIEVAPANVFGYANLAGVFFMRGEEDLAAAMLQKGLEVRPHSYLYTNLGNILFYQGRFEESIEPFRKAIDLDHGALKPAMWANLGDAYRWTPGYEEEMKSAYQEAIELVRANMETNPDDPELRGRLAIYLARRGDWSLALVEAESLEGRSGVGPSIEYFLALTYEQCGKRQKALAALRRALELGYSFDAVEREQELDRLRADPSFSSLIRHFKGDSTSLTEVPDQETEPG